MKQYTMIVVGCGNCRWGAKWKLSSRNKNENDKREKRKLCINFSSMYAGKYGILNKGNCKKNLFFIGPATKNGGGVKAGPLRKRILFCGFPKYSCSMWHTGNIGDLEKCRVLAFRSLWKQGYYVGEGNLPLNLRDIYCAFWSFPPPPLFRFIFFPNK